MDGMDGMDMAAQDTVELFSSIRSSLAATDLFRYSVSIFDDSNNSMIYGIFLPPLLLLLQ